MRLAELTSDYRLAAHCTSCQHDRELKARDLVARFGADALTTDVRPRLRYTVWAGAGGFAYRGEQRLA